VVKKLGPSFGGGIAMNFIKKILLVHGEAKARRTLTLLFAGAGYDVRSCGRSEVALETARSEWFDLSVVADPLLEMGSFEFIAALRKLQPSVPVLLLVNQLELSFVIKGIRLAVTDVLAPCGDWAAVTQRVNAFLRPGETPAEADLTPEELAEVEAILAKFDNQTADPMAAAGGLPAQTDALRAELQRLARERDDFKKTTDRLAQERTALEAELKTQLVKHADVARLEVELTELRSDREVVTATQAAVDDKARALANAREELACERAAFAAERTEGMSAEDAKRLKSVEELAREREILEDLRLDFRAEDVRLREEAMKTQQAQSQLEAERRQLQDDIDLLREQEANLRAYEQRLRSLTVEVEADRVHRAVPRASHDPFVRDPSLEEAWNKVNRAMDLLEAERRGFNDEMLVLKEEKMRMQECEARLQGIEAQLAERAQILNAPRPSFTREPFKAAKAIFTGGNK
jgi:DNA-binding response OmpR family regulator